MVASERNELLQRIQEQYRARQIIEMLFQEVWRLFLQATPNKDNSLKLKQQS